MTADTGPVVPVRCGWATVAVGSQLRLPIWLPPVTPRTRRNAAAWRRLCASQRPVLTGRRLGIGVVEETLAEVAGLLG